jgi:hypothetical protein
MREHGYSPIERAGVLVCASMVIVAGVVLFCFDPTRYHFYPTCIFHRTTGLLCPGCGSLRALHQLLHGHVLMAFRFNPLLVFTLISLTGLGVLYKCRKLSLPPLTPRWFWVAGIVFLVVSIWRNLPGAPALITPP